MPGEVRPGEPIIALPENFQQHGGGRGEEVIESSALQEADELDEGFEVEDPAEEQVATIDEWLGTDPSTITKWVSIPRLEKKILIRAMTDQERSDLRKKAPDKFVRSGGRGAARKRVKDSEWIQLETIRTHVVQPQIPPPPHGHDLLKKSLAGELLMVLQEISELSGFDLSDVSGGSEDLD